MRTLREVLGPTAMVSKERKSVIGSLGSQVANIYKDKIMTPHQVMEELEKSYESEPIFRSAIDMVTDFIFGGDIVFKSDDKVTEVRGNAYITALGFNEWVPQAIRTTTMTGNGYVEIDYNPISGLPQKFYPQALSSRFFVNCNEYGEPLEVEKVVFDEETKSYNLKKVPNDKEYYLQRIDPNIQHRDAKWYDLSYNYGSKFMRFRIYAIPIHKDKIIHFKINLGFTGLYGTTHFAAAIDDKMILRELERSIAILARYKAVPRKVIQYGDKDNSATGEELDDFIVYMESLERDEDPIVNKPIKIDDLSYAGGEINLDYMLQHIRKKLISGVVPDFLTGFGQDVNRSTAQVQLISFVLSIYAKRKAFLHTLEEKIIKPWLEQEGLEEGYLEFNELDFETKQEKANRVMQLWSGNIITLNRALDLLGESKVGDVGDTYYTKWQNEMMNPTQQNSQGMGYVPTLLPGGRPITQEEPVPERQTPFEDDATTMPPSYSLSPEYFKEKVGKLKDDPAGLDPLINQTSYKIRSVYQEKLNKVKSFNTVEKIEEIYNNLREKYLKDFLSMKEYSENNINLKEILSQKEVRELATFLRIEEGNIKPHVEKAVEEAWIKGNLDSCKKIGLQSYMITNDKHMNKLKSDAFKWVQKAQNEGADKIEDVLFQGVVGKAKGNELEEKVEKAYNFISWKSEQLARTELRKAYSEGVKYVMQNSPYKEYVWHTSGRESVCKVCNSLNGKKFRVEDIRQQMAPLHPNCSCSCEVVVQR